MKHIVIIGGGFAGINLAQNIAKGDNFRITLVDRNNYNFFPPLLYQVATAFLEASNISYPFRKLFRDKKNVSFRNAEFMSVNPAENMVSLSNGMLSYDYLVFATGAQTNYFGMDNVQKNALPMKTLNDALELRNHILQQLEEASCSTDLQEIKKKLTVVVAGAGPTGVEVSGMLAEMNANIFAKDYPELNKLGFAGEIYLVDGGANVLAPMSASSQDVTYNALEKMGVKILLNSQVKDYDGETVILNNGTRIESRTLVWAAGVSASDFKGLPAGSYGRAHRLIVDNYNRISGLANCFAIGDTCILSGDENYRDGHPQLAQVAIQQGKNLAINFTKIIQGKASIPFKYTDKGSMAIISRNKAVVDLPRPKLHINGFIAWLLWVFVHLTSLVSYRNRIKTLYNWTGAYFSKDQSLRMIIRPAQNMLNK